MILCKASVRVTKLRREIWKLLPVIEEIFSRYNRDAVITCWNEAHEEDDPHTHGFAIDLRSKVLPSEEAKFDVLYQLREQSGPDYTVLLEDEGGTNEHFHIQIKKGLWRTLLSAS